MSSARPKATAKSGATHGGLKILRLDLLAYGPFTGQSLDLSAGNEGLHIVYGPNEAGKSTTLRALRALLFGIGHVTADNHVHANNDLRIGAVLRLPSGEELSVIRRKGRANTLRAADDATPIDAKLLEAALGHIDDRAFDARFGIDHQQLVAGGQEIAAGQGDVGQLLFAASAGIAHLSGLQTKLRDEAESLYKPRGQNPAINAGLGKFNETAKSLRAVQLSAGDWEQRQRELADARSQLARVEQELSGLEAAKKRLERHRAALPLASRRAALLEELDVLGAVPSLSEDFCRRRRELSQQQCVAAEAEKSAAAELAQLDEQLAALGAPPAILDDAETVERIAGEMSSHVKAAKDRVGLSAELAQFARQIDATLERIGGESSDGEEVRIVLRAADRARIEELSHAHHDATLRCESAERRRTQIQQSLDERSAELAALPEVGDDDALKRLVRRVQPLAAEESRLAVEAARIDADERQFAVDFGRLPCWNGDAEELVAAAVPSSEAVDEFETRWAQARQALDQAIERRDRAAEEAAATDEELAALVEHDDVPSEECLADWRESRDNAWAALRRALRDGDLPRAEDLAGKFEILAAEADRTADRLRQESEAAARRSELERQSARHAATLDRATAEVEERQRELAAAERQWTALWAESGVEPAAPREMRRWLSEHRRLCEVFADLRRRRAEQQAKSAQIDEAKRELLAAVQRCHDAPNADAVSIAQAVEFADRQAEAIAAQRQRRREVEADRSRLARESRELDDEIARATADLDRWRSAWKAAVAPLGHDADLSPQQAQAVLHAIGELENLVDKRHDRAARIAGIDRDTAEYAAAVAEIATRAAPDVDVAAVVPQNIRTVERVVAELARRLDEAKANAAQRKTLLAARDRKAADLAATRQRAATVAAELTALCREAGAEAVDELPAIEDRWRRRDERSRQLDELEERLHEHAGGAAIHEFLVELAGVDADALDGELARAESRLTELAEERDRLNKQVWTLEREAEQTYGRADAARIDAELHGLRAQLEDDVGRYARLRLASAVLRGAIERYRERNQDPLLRRASEIFSALTSGSFAQLKTDYDDQRPVLVAVRANSADAAENAAAKTVGVAGMSDGTCDQLYLALRLASVEQYIDAHPAIPFIVDDVLQRFDDGRAAAALGALAELGRRTQVIFFTHHRHVVDLATRRLADGEYFIHELGERIAATSARSPMAGKAATPTKADESAALF